MKKGFIQFLPLIVGTLIIVGTLGYGISGLWPQSRPYFGATILYPGGGGTGTSTKPTYGRMLVGNAGGTYTLTATSSLGLGGSGTVTSVDMSVPTGFSISGNPVTTSGILALTFDTGYELFKTASGTNWNTFYDTPSNRITDGTGLTWSTNTLNCDTASGSAAGCLSAANWTTFNNKWDTLGDISLDAGYMLVGNPSNVASATSTLFISQAGNIGIGTTTPNFPLHIETTSNRPFSATNADRTRGMEVSIQNYATGFLLWDDNGAGNDSYVANCLSSDPPSSSSNACPYTNYFEVAYDPDNAWFFSTGGVVFSTDAPDFYFADGPGNELLRISDAGSFGLLTVSNASTTAFSSGYASSTSLYAGTAYLPSLGTAAGSFLAVNTTGQIIATTTPTGGMVYPGAGIALSTGSAWNTSITNNSANWNTAYGWGNHAGLYDVLGQATGTIAIHNAAYNHSNYDTAFGWGNHSTAGYNLQSYASSTYVWASDWTTIDNYPTGCTNEFIRTIGDTLTCAAVNLTNDTTGTLSITKGGTGQDWSAISAGSIPYFNTLGVLTTLASSTGGSVLQLSFTTGKPSWVATTSLNVTAVDLSCTDCIGVTEISDVYLLNNGDIGTGVYDFGGATSFELPNGASGFTNITGQMFIDTTSGQLRFNNGTGTSTLIADRNLVWATATSTAWSGTTTRLLLNVDKDMTVNYARCKTTVGTLSVALSNQASTYTNYLVATSSTSNTIRQNFTSNNIFYAGDTIYGYYGSPASSPVENNCNFVATYNAD